MNKIIVLIHLLTCFTIYSQDINPFESIGKEGKILTLSNGKYKEFHDNDSLQRIGSVIVNTNTGTIYELLNVDTLYSESTLDPTVISRWYSPDAVVKHNESPYASMSNNPIWFGDKDGNDTLVMNRQLMPEYTKIDDKVLVYKVTFSIIKNGVEESLGKTMYMYANKEQSQVGYNKLPNKTYKLTWDQLSAHKDQEGWENTIRIFKGVFIHPGNNIDDFGGCVGISESKPVQQPEFEGSKNDMISIKNSVKGLQTVRDLYNKVDGENNALTGDKFILKNNSIAPPVKKQDTPAENKTIEKIKVDPLPLIPAKQLLNGGGN